MERPIRVSLSLDVLESSDVFKKKGLEPPSNAVDRPLWNTEVAVKYEIYHTTPISRNSEHITSNEPSYPSLDSW